MCISTSSAMRNDNDRRNEISCQPASQPAMHALTLGGALAKQKHDILGKKERKKEEDEHSRL